MTFLFEDSFSCDTLYVNAFDIHEAIDKFERLKESFDSSDFEHFHIYVRIS